MTLNEAEPRQLPEQLWQLFQQLRRRGFQLGIADFLALRDAVWAGFGLASSDELQEVCTLLWAKSSQEIEILAALFERLNLPTWNIFQQDAIEQNTQQDPLLERTPPPIDRQDAPTTQSQSVLPPIVFDEKELPQRCFVLTPILPLTRREIAQAWRRLRRSVQQGPSVDIDIEATITQRSRTGVATPIVLKPRRRNTVRLLLLIDRQGSMAPFHRLSEEVATTIQHIGRLEQVACYYYHNLPTEGTNEAILAAMADSFFPSLDAHLAQIIPANSGYVYSDPTLLTAFPLEEVLSTYAPDVAAVIISDAGAARGSYNAERLLDTIAFMKAIHEHTPYAVWLNPLPEERWQKSSAEQIARHVPMFPLDRLGMYRAINVLRGQPAKIERPI